MNSSNLFIILLGIQFNWLLDPFKEVDCFLHFSFIIEPSKFGFCWFLNWDAGRLGLQPPPLSVFSMAAFSGTSFRNKIPLRPPVADDQSVAKPRQSPLHHGEDDQFCKAEGAFGLLWGALPIIIPETFLRSAMKVFRQHLHHAPSLPSQ